MDWRSRDEMESAEGWRRGLVLVAEEQRRPSGDCVAGRRVGVVDAEKGSKDEVDSANWGRKTKSKPRRQIRVRQASFW
ncbi:unnamed protein product [Linum trigynum]|uniref:Uncharacterized protein n=1 Tax=Linum trigynum TaxID=586398 RepID=A0AAV2FN73_9ROSI